ncbi:MAG: hypothetical protein ABJA93_05065, partial [Sporichthyaceae bacterium]
MDTLHDRLAELANDAPTGGAPAAELWARGKRAYRLRAAALAATLLVVGAVGTGVGVRLVDGDDNRSDLAPAGTVGISLPIQYPAGEELPDLGDTPGPLAAIWLAPRVGGGAPEAVGLVADTGMFGTLPIDLPDDDPQAPDALTVALSADGRMIAYPSPTGELIVHDLVSGESSSPLSEFQTRAGYTWIDATHLVGHVAGGSDVEGWVWEPGTAPTLVNPYGVRYGGTDLSLVSQGGGPQSCSSPTRWPTLRQGGGAFGVPVLCDILGVIGSEILLGHWNSDRLPGDWNDPNDGNRTVVALNIHGADVPFEDPALRHVVATAGAPERVSFAT